MIIFITMDLNLFSLLNSNIMVNKFNMNYLNFYQGNK